MKQIFLIFCLVVIYNLTLTSVYAKKEFKGLEIQTIQDWEWKAREIPKSNRNIPKPFEYQDVGLVILPDPFLKLEKYNFPAGSREIDLSPIKKKKQLTSQGVASSDCKQMAYVNYYYLPSSNQISSELFIIPLKSSLNKVNAIANANIGSLEPKQLLEAGRNEIEKNLYKTLTIVDFSPDNQKLLVKEKTGSAFDGIWQTDSYLIDLNTYKVTKFAFLRESVEDYWRYQGVYLRDYRWDISPLGFDANDSQRIIFLAYAYANFSKTKFLGAWSVKINGSNPMLLSLSNTTYKIVSTGLVLRKEINPYALPKRQVKTFFKPTLKRKKIERLERELEKRQNSKEY